MQCNFKYRVRVVKSSRNESRRVLINVYFNFSIHFLNFFLTFLFHNMINISFDFFCFCDNNNYCDNDINMIYRCLYNYHIVFANDDAVAIMFQ